MSLDGKLLARAKTALEDKRRRHDELYQRRLEAVYARAPRVRELDDEIRSTMTDLVGIALNAAGGKLEDIRSRNLGLQEQRRSEIRSAGFPDDYLDDDYMCPECHDSGFTHTGLCRCLMQLYKEAQKESLSSLLKLGNETFDSFDLSYYADTLSPDTTVSIRRSMEIILEICIEYARNFGKKSMNLFFIGEPGLGKTFLSACIARVVAENGYSVVYDMAASIFGKFEEAKFTRMDDPEETRAEIRRYLECDLLIVDDLGAEMTTAFTTSALYDIVNTRLITNRKTIVSSNLTIGEMHRRYSGQIMSRLEGEYQVLTFRGDDIRKKRNS